MQQSRKVATFILCYNFGNGVIKKKSQWQKVVGANRSAKIVIFRRIRTIANIAWACHDKNFVTKLTRKRDGPAIIRQTRNAFIIAIFAAPTTRRKC